MTNQLVIKRILNRALEERRQTWQETAKGNDEIADQAIHDNSHSRRRPAGSDQPRRR